MLIHLQSLIVDLNLSHKFDLDRIHSFGDIAIFWAFWLEIAYLLQFWGFGLRTYPCDVSIFVIVCIV